MAKPTKIKKTIDATLAWAEKQDAKAKGKEHPAAKINKETDERIIAGLEPPPSKPPEVFTNKVGRPTKYEGDKTCRQVKVLASKGFTDLEMSEALDISESSFHEWKKDHPLFLESITEGKDQIDEMVVKSLFNRALGCSIKETKVHVTKDGDVVETEVDRNFPPDPTSMIFWLKNRRPKEWRDKHEVDFTSPLTIQMGEKDQNTL